jgi:hypothetical protein
MRATLMYAGMLALATATAEAVEMDANSVNYMLPHCKGYLSGSNALDVGFCAGVVEGIGYMAAILEMSNSPGAGPPLCVPKGITRGHTVCVVVNYIEARPKRMDAPFLAVDP